MDYLDLLWYVHHKGRTRRYLEIGVAQGNSLRCTMPTTDVWAVDPYLENGIPFNRPNTSWWPCTSDAFFAKIEGSQLRSFDTVFIDGDHSFTQVLLDLANSSQYTTTNSIIFLHDVLPNSPPEAEDRPRTPIWTGDVWKILPVLGSTAKAHNLCFRVWDIPPTGMAAIIGLCGVASQWLTERIPHFMEKFSHMEWEDYLSIRQHCNIEQFHPEEGEVIAEYR